MAADCGKCDGVSFRSRQLIVDGSKRCFHNTAGHTEDNACAGVVAHDVLVPTFVGETLKDDAGTLDHSGQFSRGDDSIDIRKTIHLKLLALALVLLSGTRHDGDYENVLGCHVVDLGPVGFDDGSLHLVRGLAGGQVRQQIAVVVLRVVYPARGTGSDHGQDAAVL